MPTIIATHGIRMIIGKGGMGPATQAACVRHGCVYVQATGGAAQFLRQRVQSVKAVYFLEEFGPAEALWELVVENFPGIVAIDSHGCSIYDTVATVSQRRLTRLMQTP